jgi:hypothetical protein
VESSKLAQANAQDAKVKTFAAKSGKVKVELPAVLDSSHQSKLDKLKDDHLETVRVLIAPSKVASDLPPYGSCSFVTGEFFALFVRELAAIFKAEKVSRHDATKTRSAEPRSSAS